jgi:translation initiation factor IF-1
MGDKIEVIGEVIDLVRDVIRVQVDGKIILATQSGKIRMNGIQIVRGDQVKVQISSADFTRGRVVKRL